MSVTSARAWAHWILGLQLLLLAVMLLGMFCHKFELLSFRPAFMAFYYGIQVVLLVTVVALLALVICALIGKKDPLKPLGFTLALGALPVAIVLVMVGKGLGVPQIHNISTDLENPPEFVAVYGLDVERINSLDAPSAEVRDLQRNYYKSIQPLALPAEPEQVLESALTVIDALGWHLVAADREVGRIEAYEETLLFGFKDDVVIRLTPTDLGTRVDVRSVSRVGRSDLGANAARIERLLTKLKAAHSS